MKQAPLEGFYENTIFIHSNPVNTAPVYWVWWQ
jgi:hypothetical protein